MGSKKTAADQAGMSEEDQVSCSSNFDVEDGSHLSWLHVRPNMRISIPEHSFMLLLPQA